MDPRVQQPFDVTPGGKLQPRSANHSPLMAALTKASLGEKVNFCPFGCKDEDLDENGYCDHLVGFTSDGKSFEPQIKDERGQRHVQGGRGEPVLKTDRLERITTSSRVYRELPVPMAAGTGCPEVVPEVRPVEHPGGKNKKAS